MIDRRLFLALSGGSLGAVLLPGAAAAAGTAADGSPLYASCVRTDDDRYGVAVIDETGAIRALHPLPDRGHDVAFEPRRGLCVAFARRPGTFAVVFAVEGRRAPVVIAAAPGRHFYGHGVFTADGGLMLATEHDLDSGEGLVGLYDVRDGFRRVSEFPTGGKGPHELVWCADGRTLAIANGGLETDPAFGRRNLNSPDMRSGLVLLEADGGRILSTVGTGSGLEMLSIRHLAVDRRGAVWFGCQSEGDRTAAPPLVGRMHGDGRVEMIDLPAEVRHRPRNYIGSVALSGDGGTVAVSAPRGGLVLGFDASTGRFLGSVSLADGCGLAPADAGLLGTSGTGRVARVHADGDGLAGSPAGRSGLAFDNHLARLG